MFSRLIRLYIIVSPVCLLSRVERCGASPDHAPLSAVKMNVCCKNYTAHAQSIFLFNVCGKNNNHHRGTVLTYPPNVIS